MKPNTASPNCKRPAHNCLNGTNLTNRRMRTRTQSSRAGDESKYQMRPITERRWVRRVVHGASDTALALYGIHKDPQNRHPKQVSKTDFPPREESCGRAYFARLRIEPGFQEGPLSDCSERPRPNSTRTTAAVASSVWRPLEKSSIVLKIKLTRLPAS